jgi:hypothetical protein
MDRLWRYTLVLGLLLFAIWGYTWWYGSDLLHRQNDNLMLAGAIVVLGFTLFAFFARRMAYVQPRNDHLRLVTPFLRANISYRRVRSTHPAEFAQLFPVKDASWAQRRLLEPLYGKTAVVLELISYPLPPVVMRLFLAPQMFSRQYHGFVLLVPDWMKFSTEMDTLMGVWLQAQKRRR